MINSEPETSKIKILKRSEPVPQSLIKTESRILKSKVQKNKTVDASWKPKPKGVKPKVLVNQKQPSSQHKVQEVKNKSSSTNPKGPIKQWVPKSKFVNTADMPESKRKAQVMVPRQWMFKDMTGEKSMFLTLTTKEGGKVKFGSKPIWQDHWYRNYW